MYDLVKAHLINESAADTPDIDSSAAAAEFAFYRPVMLTKVGVRVTTNVVADNSVPLVLEIYKRPTAGSASNQEKVGEFVVAAPGVTVPAGDIVIKELASYDEDGEVAEDGSKRHVAPNLGAGHYKWLLKPGESLLLQIASGAEADSGAVVSFVEYVPMPWAPYNLKGNVRVDTSRN